MDQSGMKVVLFAGGFGVRSGEHTQRIPKPLHLLDAGALDDALRWAGSPARVS